MSKQWARREGLQCMMPKTTKGQLMMTRRTAVQHDIDQLEQGKKQVIENTHRHCHAESSVCHLLNHIAVGTTALTNSKTASV